MITRRSDPIITGGIVKKTINPPPLPGTSRPPPPRSQTASRTQINVSGVVTPKEARKAVRAGIDVSAISLRHDLPLVNWTVVVRFADRPDERFPVQARDPLSASRLISYTSEREWSAEKLLAVKSIHPVRE